MRLLALFRCYLEGSGFEIITDNQALKSLLFEKDFNPTDAGWVHTLGNFGIFPIVLEKGKIHVLGDALSRIPNSSSDGSVFLNHISTIEPRQRVHEMVIEHMHGDNHFGKI